MPNTTMLMPVELKESKRNDFDHIIWAFKGGILIEALKYLQPEVTRSFEATKEVREKKDEYSQDLFANIFTCAGSR